MGFAEVGLGWRIMVGKIVGCLGLKLLFGVAGGVDGEVHPTVRDFISPENSYTPTGKANIFRTSMALGRASRAMITTPNASVEILDLPERFYEIAKQFIFSDYKNAEPKKFSLSFFKRRRYMIKLATPGNKLTTAAGDFFRINPLFSRITLPPKLAFLYYPLWVGKYARSMHREK